MPGFSDNLRRAREAAGLTPEDLADRVGAAPIWLAHLEALGASLPELPHLVRLADALGCRIDDLLAGGDADFDHPRRRHAALIAARLGRINLAQSRVNAARGRGELTRLDELCLDEPALLSSVCRCRGWVTSPTSELSIATSLERELDDHLARLVGVMQRVDSRADSVRARTLANLPPPATVVPPRADGTTAGQATARTGMAPNAPTVAAPAVQPGTAAAPPGSVNGTSLSTPPKPPASILKADVAVQALSAAVALPQLPELPRAPAAADVPLRRPGRYTTMWSRPGPANDEFVCEMVTQGTSVELVLTYGERELAAHPCRNLDEAFTQSSKWKRIPDIEAHFADSAA